MFQNIFSKTAGKKPACQPLPCAVPHTEQRAYQLCFSNCKEVKIVNRLFERKISPSHGHCVIPGNTAANSDASPLLLIQSSAAVTAHVFRFQSFSDEMLRLGSCLPTRLVTHPLLLNASPSFEPSWPRSGAGTLQQAVGWMHFVRMCHRLLRRLLYCPSQEQMQDHSTGSDIYVQLTLNNS